LCRRPTLDYLANRRVSGDSNKIRQSPIRILDVDDEAVGQFGDGIFIRSITERAGLAWRAAAARMSAVPRALRMRLIVADHYECFSFTIA